MANEERRTLLIRSHDQSASRCQACGAAIVWTISRHGRRMPMNEGFQVAGYQPNDDGSFTLVQVYADQTHWATCPFAERFKKGRAA